MSGVTDLFAIGASGAAAYRAAMGGVSENISNATTEGYSRRSVMLAESPSSSATSIFYKAGVSFGGVVVQTISRSNDPYLDLASRNASSSFESADVRATWLSDIQSALDDSTLGVGQQLGTMFASVEKLAANPTDTTLRQNLLFGFEQINQAFADASSALGDIKTGIASTATNEVTALNDALQKLSDANEGLRRSVVGSSNAAQLLDQRDLALANIAKQMNSTVTFTDNGVANVTYDGQTLVDGITPATVALTTNADGTLAFSVDGTAVATPTNGRLSGLATSASLALTRETSLNALAAQYVSDINGWHQNGLTDAGAPGGAMLSIGANAGTIQLLITDTDDIAATSSSGVINGNLLSISSLRLPGGVEDGWNAMVAAHANLLNATNSEQTASSQRYQQAESARADVSGVDLDREAADLLRLQQAYQGCARIIQVAKECSQAIMAVV